MAMVNPPHPGGIVKSECLEPLGLSVSKAAEGLGASRQALSELVNEKSAVSAEMAIRLSRAFGSSPETWLGMQTAYDLWEAQERVDELQVTRLAPASAVTDL
ncbi:MAG: HigA family addiction module antitoxin [Acidobacteriota bacterium]|nr:HigA family addiction module antitoxin [Chloroflexota bacterium]MDE2898377.1 HigA family addiction module antitoxin [Chloroflexota bacterium]MDE2962580.1 HigA family addiction module antitoxin [Acidobacteriota bacterium]